MKELISSTNLRYTAAELIATFMFVFMGVGAVGAATHAGLSLMSPFDTAGLIVIALGHGLGIFLGIIVFGRITGAHMNPAVTIATVISGNLSVIRGVSYVLGQLIGAIVAIVLIDTVVWNVDSLGVHGLTVPTNKALAIEVILTFFLVFTIFASVIDKRGNAAWAPIAIGLVVFVDHLIAVPLTGASMNPARTLGPALVHGDWADHWVYWAGPIIGGIVAAVTYVLLFCEKSERDKLGCLKLTSEET